MNRRLFFIVSFCLLISGCNNLDSVNPSQVNAFVFSYGGTGNYKASAVLSLQDGYLITGDSVGIEDVGMIIIKTDFNGKTQWRKRIKGGTVSSAISTPTGYIICGDSVLIDLNELSVINQTRTKMRLIAMDFSGNIIADKSFGNFGDITINDPNRQDEKGNAVVLFDAQKLVVTSTVSLPYASPALNTYTQVSAHDLVTLNQTWSKAYNQDNTRNYKNGKSVLLTQTNNIIWATSSFSGTTSNGVSFLRIPVLVPDTAPVNGDTYGQNDPNNYYSGNDIKRNYGGFGIVGTFQSSAGSNANIFFIRADPTGNLISNSALFFDGSVNESLNENNKNSSLVQDQGITLTATADGGFLIAGTTSTTADGRWGNGGKDIYLIKMDGLGNMIWNKFLGGSGDDIPSDILQTTDGGFIIAGTSTLAGQSSMFLIKTNTLGELKN